MSGSSARGGGGWPRATWAIVRAGPAEMQHCPAAHSAGFLLQSTFQAEVQPRDGGRGGTAPRYLPSCPPDPRAIKGPRFSHASVILAWAAMLWLLGDRTSLLREQGVGRGCQPLPPPVTTTLQLAGKQKQFLRLASLPGVQGLVGLVSAEDPGREGFHTKQKFRKSA